MSIVAYRTLNAASLQTTSSSYDDGSAAIRAIVNPPTACPSCFFERGEPWPASNPSTRICERHAAEMRARSEALKSHRRH